MRQLEKLDTLSRNSLFSVNKNISLVIEIRVSLLYYIQKYSQQMIFIERKKSLTVKTCCLIFLLSLFMVLVIYQTTKLQLKEEEQSLLTYPFKIQKPLFPLADEKQLIQIMKSQFVGDEYFNISSVEKFKELPLCVLAPPQLRFIIPKQNYSNYVIKILPRNKMNYDELETFIQVNCFERQLVVIVEQELEEGAFVRINNLFQRFKVWSAYLQTLTQIKIVAFYRELFLKVRSNDFKHKNEELFLDDNQNPVALALLQLSSKFIKKTENLFKDEKNFKNTLLTLEIQNQLLKVNQNLNPYQTLLSLSQSQINLEYAMKMKDNIFEIKNPRKLLTNNTILKGLEDIEINNLPLNHSLFERDKIYMESTYNLSEYAEVPICVVILSRNNQDNNRYQKVLSSLFFQNYRNFRTIFIDDASSDFTFQLTKQYAQALGFDPNKISFVKNKKRKYATYNLHYAATKFCYPHEVFIPIDGDDELIGRQVFRLISSYYQKEKENWIVYTSYIGSNFMTGNSNCIPEDFLEDPHLYRQRPYHFMGPVRSFLTALFLKIRNKDHKYKNGKYFDTMYDEAMQKPMFEMSGKRIEYIPEICYLYRQGLPESDGATKQKLKKRRNAWKQVLRRKAYHHKKQILTPQLKEKFKNATLRQS